MSVYLEIFFKKAFMDMSRVTILLVAIFVCIWCRSQITRLQQDKIPSSVVPGTCISGVFSNAPKGVDKKVLSQTLTRNIPRLPGYGVT